MMRRMDKPFAVKKAGSEAALASLLGVSRQAVNQWRVLPPLRAYQLKELKPRWAAEFKKRERQS